jgi:hypothetical protein
MKKIRVIAFCILIFTSSGALAFEISWMHVQHRVYGAGQDFNRLGFGLIDDRGNYVSDNKSITAVKLYDPNNKEVKISEVIFDSIEEIYGSYDAKNSQWFFSKTWQYDSWFHAKILEALIPGIYLLKVTTTDGKVSERTFAFRQLIDLPILDSDSIQFQYDEHGNLIWTWKIPTELGQLTLSHKTRARASIDIYKNDNNVGYFSIILPVHLGYVVIPSEIVQLMNQRGDRFDVKIQMETRDKNNRTYSRPFTIKDQLTAVSK